MKKYLVLARVFGQDQKCGLLIISQYETTVGFLCTILLFSLPLYLIFFFLFLIMTSDVSCVHFHQLLRKGEKYEFHHKKKNFSKRFFLPSWVLGLRRTPSHMAPFGGGGGGGTLQAHYGPGGGGFGFPVSFSGGGYGLPTGLAASGDFHIQESHPLQGCVRFFCVCENMFDPSGKCAWTRAAQSRLRL